MPIPARPGTWLAFLGSLALHATALGIGLSGGGPPGDPAGTRGLTVEIISQDKAADMEVATPDKADPSAAPEALSESGLDDREERLPTPLASRDAPDRGAAPRLVASTTAPFEIGGTQTSPDPIQAPKADRPARRPDAKAGPVGARDARRARSKDKPDRRRLPDPIPTESSSNGDGAGRREAKRMASLGGTGMRAGPMPPAWREVLVALLQQQIERCYAAPADAAAHVVLPVLDIRLRPSGAFAAEPRIARSGGSRTDLALAAAALRAVRRCAPYQIPGRFAPFYEDWKDIRAEFEFSAS